MVWCEDMNKRSGLCKECKHSRHPNDCLMTPDILKQDDNGDIIECTVFNNSQVIDELYNTIDVIDDIIDNIKHNIERNIGE